MIAEKNNEGAWVVSDIVNGYRVSRRYYFYTKREAVRLFRQEMRANA
jgi:5-bromo-4-chloroindolyl phosphate hydrolysis protein